MGQKARSGPSKPFGDTLSGFQIQTLVVVHDLGEAKGTKIVERLADEFETNVQLPRFYHNVDILVDMGLVNKGKFDDRTNAYTITEKGKRKLNSHIEWEIENGPLDYGGVLG